LFDHAGFFTLRGIGMGNSLSKMREKILRIFHLHNYPILFSAILKKAGRRLSVDIVTKFEASFLISKYLTFFTSNSFTY